MRSRIALASGIAALACAAPVSAAALSQQTTTVAPPASSAQVQPFGGPVAILASRRVPNLVDKRLDRAESELDAKGIGFKTEGGGLFGIVLKRDWGVCDTIPHAGMPVRGPVKLIVGHYSCGA